MFMQRPIPPEKHRAAKPLYAALVRMKFLGREHRFAAPFGSVWEKLARRCQGAMVIVQGHAGGMCWRRALKTNSKSHNSLEHSRKTNRKNPIGRKK